PGVLVYHGGVGVDEFAHIVTRIRAIPIFHTAISGIQAIMNYFFPILHHFILAGLDLAGGIAACHVGGTWLPIGTIVQNRGIEARIAALIRCDGVLWVTPIERRAVGQSVIIHQLLGRRIPRPIVVTVGAIVSAHIITALIFEVDKKPAQYKIRFAVDRNCFATSTHSNRHIVLHTFF